MAQTKGSREKTEVIERIRVLLMSDGGIAWDSIASDLRHVPLRVLRVLARLFDLRITGLRAAIPPEKL